MPEPIAELALGELLERLGSKSPAPGGGAVAPVVGALACALAQMVVVYSTGRKSAGDHGEELVDAGARLVRARGALVELADADAEAYTALNAALKMSNDDPGRARQIAACAGAAIVPPLATMAACVDLLRLFERLATITSARLSSDLRIAAVLAEAAVRASAENVRVNAPLLGDSDRGGALERECERSINDAARRAGLVRASGRA